MLWRSERGLDRSAVQLMEILRAVDEAGSPAAATTGSEAAPLEFFLGPTPAQLGKLGGRKGDRKSVV